MVCIIERSYRILSSYLGVAETPLVYESVRDTTRVVSTNRGLVSLRTSWRCEGGGPEGGGRGGACTNEWVQCGGETGCLSHPIFEEQTSSPLPLTESFRLVCRTSLNSNGQAETQHILGQPLAPDSDPSLCSLCSVSSTPAPRLRCTGREPCTGLYYPLTGGRPRPCGVGPGSATGRSRHGPAPARAGPGPPQRRSSGVARARACVRRARGRGRRRLGRRVLVATVRDHREDAPDVAPGQGWGSGGLVKGWGWRWG